MPKVKSGSIDVRGLDGVVHTLSPEQFYELDSPAKFNKPKVRRARCTFLPGVKPEVEVRYEYLEDGTVLEHLG